MKQMTLAELTAQCHYFDTCEDRERLMHDSPAEALQALRDESTDDEWTDNEVIKVFGWAHQEINHERWAEDLIERMREDFSCSDYGDPDGDPDNFPDDKVSEELMPHARALVDAYFARNTVWACDHIGYAEVTLAEAMELIGETPQVAP